jgi:hypothetical protein
MSGLFGTQAEEDYFQVGTVKLPLPRNAEGRSEEFETLRTTPLEPFQASTVLGDSSLISDDRIAQAVFSDFRPGLGKRHFVAAESLSGYQDGDLLTVEGVATLPPRRRALAIGLASIPAPFTPGPVLGFLFSWSARYQFALYYPVLGTVKVWDSVGSAFVAQSFITGGSPPVDPTPPYNAFARWGQYYVFCELDSQGGIWYSTDGQSYNQGWTPGGNTRLQGIVAHDGKLYVVRRDIVTNDITLHWIATVAQLTAGIGVAWPGVATATITLQSAEVITNLVDWKDERNNRQIYLMTTRRIVAYDDADFFTEFWQVPNPVDTARPFLLVSPRDDLLYACFGFSNNSVFVFNHQTVEETGPNKEFGIPKGNANFSIAALIGNSRHMFALGLGPQGRVLIANDAFGWSPFVRARLTTASDLNSAPLTSAEVIVGMFYGGSRLVIVTQGGTVEYLDWPDEAASVYNFAISGSVPDVRAYEQGPFYLYSPEFDAGNELLRKIDKWWTLLVENPTGSNAAMPGLPTGCQLFFGYQFDGGSWTTYPTTINALSAFPYIIPLDPSGFPPFRKLRFRVGLQGASAGTLATPILRAVTNAYTREPDIYDGLQVVIDLSEQRFRHLDGQLFYGRDRQYLRNFIDTLKSGPTIAKAHYPVTYSYGGNVRTYASVDVRVSATEDPQDGFGHYTLTLRDLSAPLSG